MDTLPAVASKHYGACKKCGTDRYLLVIAHVDAKTAKVECEVCHSKTKIKIKAEKKATARTGRSTTGVRNKSQVTLTNEWQAMLEKAGDKPRHRYQLKEKFSKDAVIEHPQFGVGLVMAASPQKIEVIFETGIKALVHNRV